MMKSKFATLSTCNRHNDRYENKKMSWTLWVWINILKFSLELHLQRFRLYYVEFHTMYCNQNMRHKYVANFISSPSTLKSAESILSHYFTISFDLLFQFSDFKVFCFRNIKHSQLREALLKCCLLNIYYLNFTRDMSMKMSRTISIKSSST